MTLNGPFVRVHKMKHRCIASRLSAWGYVNVAEVLLVTKVHLALAEPATQCRKWEELFPPWDPVGFIALQLPAALPGPLCHPWACCFLLPGRLLCRGYKLVLTSQLGLKHLVAAVDKAGK